PQPIQDGSWYWPNENVWRLSSQPASAWPRSAEVRRTCMGCPRPESGNGTAAPLRARRRLAGGEAARLLRGGPGHRRLGGDAQRDLVADVGRVHADAELAALDRGGGVEADRLALEHRVLAGPVEGDVQDHRPGDVLDGQVAGDLQLAVAGGLDLRAPEG